MYPVTIFCFVGFRKNLLFILPMTAMVKIHKKSLSNTMATYFQSSFTLLESSALLKQ